MNSKFEKELIHLKLEYQRALGLVEKLGKGLEGNFKEKAGKIKDTCLNYFTKIDT